jgi:WhiB family redox-sensing transcriptional regulator
VRSFEWLDVGKCVTHPHPDLWHPSGNTEDPTPAVAAQIEEAKAICRSCEAVGPCLVWAIETRQPGIWGATTEDERHRMRRRASKRKYDDRRKARA